MYQITKSFTFEAAHQLEVAGTRACHECIHGHSYTVEFTVEGGGLNSMEMVADFGDFAPFKGKIMEQYDHGLILHKDKEPVYQPIIEKGHLKRSKVTFLPMNPTAEALARIFFDLLTDFINSRFFPPGNIWAKSVTVHETATGRATYAREE